MKKINLLLAAKNLNLFFQDFLFPLKAIPAIFRLIFLSTFDYFFALLKLIILF